MRHRVFVFLIVLMSNVAYCVDSKDDKSEKHDVDEIMALLVASGRLLENFHLLDYLTEECSSLIPEDKSLYQSLFDKWIASHPYELTLANNFISGMPEEIAGSILSAKYKMQEAMSKSSVVNKKYLCRESFSIVSRGEFDLIKEDPRGYVIFKKYLAEAFQE